MLLNYSKFVGVVCPTLSASTLVAVYVHITICDVLESDTSANLVPT
jgi:hypothetical protein